MLQSNTRCEKRLLDLMEEAYRVFKQHNPEGCHLSMFGTADGYCVMGYETVGGDKTQTLDGCKSVAGYYLYGRYEVS